jgi:hypothetical protein
MSKLSSQIWVATRMALSTSWKPAEGDQDALFIAARAGRLEQQLDQFFLVVAVTRSKLGMSPALAAFTPIVVG